MSASPLSTSHALHAPLPLTSRPAAVAANKTRVCIAFFQFGECPYGDGCEHAHSFFQLSGDTQARLLRSVGTDGVPAHFLSRPPACAPPSPPAPGSPAGSSTPLSSSAASGFSSSTRRGADAAAALDATFRLTLPARCRYPHRDFAGTYYDLLALPRGAAPAAVRARLQQWQREGYRAMRAADPASANAVDRLVMEARNVLGNATLRREYDALLPAAAPPASASAACERGAGCGAASASQPHGASSAALSSDTGSEGDVLERLVLATHDDDVW